MEDERTEMPLVSVVVPLYNTPEKYFAACLESLLHQTLKEIEVLIVDDGSSDGIEKRADAFSAQDRRVKVFHRENGGVSAARNFGMMQARGKYLTFLDADDRLDEDILREAAERAEHDGLDLVCWGTVRELGGKSVRCVTPQYIRVNTVYTGKELETLRLAVMDLAAPLSSPYGKIVLRERLTQNEVLFDTELRNYAEDLEWNFRLFGVIQRAVVLDAYAHHYVCNPASTTSRITAENAACAVLCIEKLFSAIAGMQEEEQLKKAVTYRALYLFTAVTISGFFHPKNKGKYAEKKRAFKEFAALDTVKQTLLSPIAKHLSFARRTVVFCMRHKWCLVLRILASIRYKSKKAA